MPHSTCIGRASRRSSSARGSSARAARRSSPAIWCCPAARSAIPRQQARDTAEFLIKYHNQFLIDQQWARRCGQWIENTYYPELEEAGLYLRRDDAGEVVTSPGTHPQRGCERAGQFRRAVHGPAAQAADQRRHPAAGGDRGHRAAAQARRRGRRRVRARRHDRRVRGDRRRARWSWPPAIPTACMRARPARGRCRATASPWPGGWAPRWPTWRCSGGTPTTSPIRRPGSACRSIPTRCWARSARPAW